MTSRIRLESNFQQVFPVPYFIRFKGFSNVGVDEIVEPSYCE